MSKETFREGSYPLLKENPELVIDKGDPVLSESFQEKKEDIIRMQGNNMEHRDE